MSNYEFIESDWKIYRERRSVWIENFMDRICKQYIDLLASGASATERIKTLYSSLQKDTGKIDIVVRDSRTYMKQNIRHLLEEDVISLKDLEGFSSELQDWASNITG